MEGADQHLFCEESIAVLWAQPLEGTHVAQHGIALPERRQLCPKLWPLATLLCLLHPLRRLSHKVSQSHESYVTCTKHQN